ncbi:MAG: relaxase/mobilization nuclease domain-containing protein [Sediminibacterium sp.]
MISKVIKPGKSFAGACRYLYGNREGAEVILSEGVRDYDHALMASDFESQRQLNPDLKSPVQHIILSWCSGEQISNELMAEISLEYLKRIEVSNTQFVVVRHNDRDNPHAHILFNRVDNEGRTIKDNFLGLRGKKSAQQLTQVYGLIPAIQKDLELTHMERMNNYDATRYEIFQALNELLPKCQTMRELKALLERQKIAMIYKYKGQTNEVQGISFTKGKFKYKGSEIDREFSFGKLTKKLTQKHVQKQGFAASQVKAQSLQKARALYHAMNIASDLMKPEHEYNPVPQEFKKKKRKRLSL